MVVCRFFLQGNCRYGNKCFNEHPSGSSQGFATTAQRQLFGGGRNQNQSNRVSFKDSYTTNQNPYRWISADAQQQQTRTTAGQTTQLSPAEIVKGLAGEVQQTWEGGNMWPFSCLGFEKDSQSLPGFTDMSFEELRHEAYEARAQGTFNIYVEKVASLLREVASQKQELKNPSMNLKQRLISFIDDDRRKRQSSSQTSLFSDSSLFGPDNSSQQSTGLFGGQSSGFEQQSTSQSAFGQSGNQSLFGQTGSSSLFGQQSQTNQSGFGQSSSGFGQSSSGIGQSSTGFGQSSGGFGQNFTGMGLTGSGQTSVFGQPVQQSTNTPSTPKVSLFGKPAVFGTPGASPVASGTFSSQPSASNQNAFGTSQVVPSGSTFGSASANQTHTATVPSSSGESPVYTSMDKLTTEEVQQFTAATFTVGQIPTKPPPKELCF